MKKLLILLGCTLLQMMGLVFAQQQQIATLQDQFSQLTDILEKMPKPKTPEKPVVTLAPTIPEAPAVPLTKEDYVKYLDTKIAELERALTPGQGIEEIVILKGIREDVKAGASLQKAVAQEIPEAPAIIPEAPGIPAAPELPSEAPVAPPVPTLEKPSKQPVIQKKTEVKKTPSPRDDVMKAISEGAFKLKKAGTTPQVSSKTTEPTKQDALMKAIRAGVSLKKVVKSPESMPSEDTLQKLFASAASTKVPVVLFGKLSEITKYLKSIKWVDIKSSAEILENVSEKFQALQKNIKAQTHLLANKDVIKELSALDELIRRERRAAVTRSEDWSTE